MILSLGILKIRFPTEIALSDSSFDEFSPEFSPSPMAPSRHTFQRTQPQTSEQRPYPQISERQQQYPQIKSQHLQNSSRQDQLDLSTLGISEKPLPSFNKNDSKMDWIPSTQQNTFSTSSYHHSPFSTKKGTLPPFPGTTFSLPATTTSTSPNFFKSDSSPLHESPQQKQEIQFREQRYFAQQVCV